MSKSEILWITMGNLPNWKDLKVKKAPVDKSNPNALDGHLWFETNEGVKAKVFIDGVMDYIARNFPRRNEPEFSWLKSYRMPLSKRISRFIKRILGRNV